MNKKKDNKSNLGELIEQNIELQSNISLRPKVSEVERVSYKISSESIQKLNELKEYYKCTTKDIIDSIFDNKAFIDKVESIFAKTSDKIIIEGDRKTFVISKNTKQRIDEYSLHNNITRDVLINTMVMGFYLSHKKTLENHKWAIDILDGFRTEIHKLEGDLGERLDNDDPIMYRVGYLEGIIDGITGDIEFELKENVAIDQFG